jgi:putative transposase
MIRALIEAAVVAGARRGPACRLVGLSVRTVERWRVEVEAIDGRHGPHGPHHRPANALTPVERRTILAVVTSVAYRDLSPHQIVPHLADAGRYVGSESTMYRILRAEALLQYRGRAKAPVRRPPRAHVATGPNQLWSWDITYLRTPVRGVFEGGFNR